MMQAELEDMLIQGKGKVEGHEVYPEGVLIKLRREDGEHAYFELEHNAPARCISEGDSIEWDGGAAFWTPRREPFRDYELRVIKIHKGFPIGPAEYMKKTLHGGYPGWGHKDPDSEGGQW